MMPQQGGIVGGGMPGGMMMPQQGGMPGGMMMPQQVGGVPGAVLSVRRLPRRKLRSLRGSRRRYRDQAPIPKPKPAPAPARFPTPREDDAGRRDDSCRAAG